MSYFKSIDAKSSHYSCAMNPKDMKIWAKWMAKKLVSITNRKYKGARLVLLYRGMSGINHAAYLASALDEYDLTVEQIYIRKPNEMCHGNDTVEATKFIQQYCSKTRGVIDKYVLVFVDDFISKGETFNKCINNIFKNESTYRLPSYYEGIIIATTKNPSFVDGCRVKFSYNRLELAELRLNGFPQK